MAPGSGGGRQGMGEHLLPGKLTFSSAGGVDRLHIPIIRVCPPQESGIKKLRQAGAFGLFLV